MDIDRRNFADAWPTVQAALNACAFVCVDTELTGLHVYSESSGSLHDTLEDRYAKVKESAQAFFPPQFGIATFVWDSARERYEAHAFNFYLFPRPAGRHMLDRRVLLQASSVEFLAQCAFDWNRVFQHGIAYANRSEERELRAQLEKTLQDKQDASAERQPLPLGDHHAFIAAISEQVQAWLQGPERAFAIPPCNSFLRRLVYQEMEQASFLMGLFCSIHDVTENPVAQHGLIALSARISSGCSHARRQKPS
jgi:poly(A)-specific ribonuclease